MIPNLDIQLLGGFRLRFDAAPVTTLDLPRLQALLAYLVLHRGAPHARAHLAFLLWPDSSEAQARTNLRTLLHRLRQALPDADRFLQTDAQTVQWHEDAPWHLDVIAFEGALARADMAQQAGDRTRSCAALREAISLYHGDLLAGWYDDWVLRQRERLRQTFLAALERLILLLEETRDYVDAIGYAQLLLRHDPLHESAYQHLMRLHAVRGDRASALRTYHTCVTVLERELAVEPSPATRDAYERLMVSAALPAPSEAPPATSSTGTPRRRVFAAEPTQVPPVVAEGGTSTGELSVPLVPAATEPLVGRHAEWAQLRAIWQSVTAGRSHMVVLAGEAGVGKTRLAEELLLWIERQGLATASARCYAAEGGLVYAPVATWLRTDAIREYMLALDAIWLTEVARIVPEVLAEQPALPRPGPLTESWQRQHLFESLVRAILAAFQPRLLFLDDLQWCDQETLEWLHYLLRFDPAAPVLTVVTLRPQEIGPDHQVARLLQGLRRFGQVTEMTLGPLDAADTAALAAQIAGQPLDPALAKHLYRETEGNALFVVESVRAGTLDHAQAGQRAVGDKPGLPSATVPPTIQAVIAARLAQLSPEAQELVGLAATIGRSFTFGVLARASDADESTLVRGLDELWRCWIVHEQGADAYDFSHDKLREVAYTSLSAARRRMLHRRVAEAIEHDPAPAYPVLAYHWRQAGVVSKAIDSLAKAGEQAMHSYAHREAVDFLREALALDTQPEANTHRARRAHWEWQLGEAHFGLGQHAESREHLELAVALLGWPVPNTRGRLAGRVLRQTLRQIWHRVSPPSQTGLTHDARTELLEAARAFERLGEIYFLVNEPGPMVNACFHVINLAERAGPGPELGRAYANMCFIAGLIGLHPVAEMYRRLAHATAERVGDPSALAWVFLVTSMYTVSVGRWAETQDALHQAIAISDPRGARGQWGECSSVLADVAYYQGKICDAADIRAMIYTTGYRNGSLAHQIWGLVGHGECALRLGKTDEAITFLEVGFALLTKKIDCTFQIRTYGLLGIAYMRQAEYLLARQAADAALSLIAQSSTTPTAFYLLEGYAGVAEVHLALYEASGEQSWNERAALLDRAKQACTTFQHYARVFPIGQPRAWLWEGLHYWLAGKPGQARTAWDKSLAVAEQLGMPYEQGLAHYEIGRHTTGNDRHRHLTEACGIFSRLNASYDLKRAQTASAT